MSCAGLCARRRQENHLIDTKMCRPFILSSRSEFHSTPSFNVVIMYRGGAEDQKKPGASRELHSKQSTRVESAATAGKNTKIEEDEEKPVMHSVLLSDPAMGRLTCVYLSICPCVYVSVCLRVYASVYLCASVSVRLRVRVCTVVYIQYTNPAHTSTHNHNHTHYVQFCSEPCLCVCISRRRTLSSFVCVNISLSLSLAISASLSLVLSHFLALPLSLCLSLSHSGAL